MERLIKILHYANLLLFAWLLVRALANWNLPSLLIAFGMVVVGPLEDPLKNWVRKGPPPTDTPAVVIVDKVTSAVLLVCLIWAVYLIR
jgi:hypothetical protein